MGRVGLPYSGVELPYGGVKLPYGEAGEPVRVTTLARAVHDIEADKDQVVIVVDGTGRSDLHVMEVRGPGPLGRK